MSRADAIARKAYDKYKETHPKASRDDIKKWATAATGNYGMAHWEFPATEAVLALLLLSIETNQLACTETRGPWCADVAANVRAHALPSRLDRRLLSRPGPPDIRPPTRMRCGTCNIQ